jgi:hypothetical protein
LKRAPVANRGDQGGGGDRADAWNLREPLAGFILAGRFQLTLRIFEGAVDCCAVDKLSTIASI